MSGLTFVTTSFGPGSLVRFKSHKSYPWTYAIYRGTSKSDDPFSPNKVVGYEFSDMPLGPITRWLGYWPEFMEVATTSPSSAEKSEK